MSYFSWLDYSESERNKVLDLVNALGDRDTRDELGIGTVRDAYADLLFPGTSTIQTRARYFLLVPWIYLTIERRLKSTKAAGKEDIAKRLRNEEIGLINYLAASDDPEGTIGIEARKALKRLPSTVYWSGLSVWGIKLCHGSQDQYNHALHANGPPKLLTGRGSDDSIETDRQNWHPGLPPCPKGFPYADISFRLTGEEAGYLRERIMHNAPGTFLAFLADQGKTGTSVRFPWEHPQVGEVYGRTRKTIQHAQHFSEIIHGAALLYNYLLAKASEHEERIVEYTKKFTQWAELIQTRQVMLDQWDREEFWDVAFSMNPQIPRQTKSFVDTWFDLALNTDEPQQLLDHRQTEHFIRDRERFLKRGQARLQNQRALELWGEQPGPGGLTIGGVLFRRCLPISGKPLQRSLQMLNPHDRSLLLETLRPPVGYLLDHAIGCTFSLDLHALLTTPLAFTFFDWEDESGSITSDPLAVLESVRRNAGRISIFCQAGQISVPRKQERIFAYLEQSVHEVLPPLANGVFHPKIWLIRYTHETEPTQYRFICLSRNLTFDKSWDTVLVLDGLLSERVNAYAVNNPVGDFILRLPGLCLTSPDQETINKVEQMQYEVRRVLFEPPKGIEKFSFHPMGIPGYRNFTFAPPKRRMLVMSPFLSDNFVKNLVRQRKNCVLISRQESLETINTEILQQYGTIFSLSRDAETEESHDEVLSGLHAKLFVMDDGWKANVWTGSANATDAAFNTNVEFLVCLRGKLGDLGIGKLLGQEGHHTSFADLLQEYSGKEEPTPPDAIKKELEKRLRAVRLALLAARLFAEITPVENTREFQLELKTEFKQIIGRGTRLREDYQKLFFTIMDFKGATRLFADPYFDGEPVVIYEPGADDPVVPPEDDGRGETLIDGNGIPVFPENSFPDVDDVDNDWDTGNGVREKPSKYHIDDVAVRTAVERSQYLDVDGRLITEDYRVFLKEDIKRTLTDQYQTLQDFLRRWNESDRKKKVIDELESSGIPIDVLKQAVTGSEKFDVFDLVSHIAFDQKPLTRRERANNVKKRNYFGKYGDQAREVLESLLEKYTHNGIADLEDPKVLELPPFDRFGSKTQIRRGIFGGNDQFTQAITELEQALYDNDKSMSA